MKAVKQNLGTFKKILAVLLVVVCLLQQSGCDKVSSMPKENGVSDDIRVLGNELDQNDQPQAPEGWQVVRPHPVEDLFREHTILLVSPKNILKRPSILRAVIADSEGTSEWLSEQSIIETLRQETVVAQNSESRKSLALKIIRVSDNYSTPQIISQPDEIPGYQTEFTAEAWEQLISPPKEEMLPQDGVSLSIFAWQQVGGYVYHYQFIFERGELRDIQKREIAKDIGQFTRRH